MDIGDWQELSRLRFEKSRLASLRSTGFSKRSTRLARRRSPLLPLSSKASPA